MSSITAFGSRSRRRAFVFVAGFVALVGVSVAADVSVIDRAADLPEAGAERVDPPRPVVVLGDSAISALRWVPNADLAIIGFEHTLDLESCRRLYYPSCRGREGRTPPTVHAALLDHHDNYRTLVVATGYNDGTAGFRQSFEQVVQRARDFGYEQIVWYTLRSDVDYVSPGDVSNHETFAANNQIVRDLLATGRFPEVVLADWDGYTAGQSGWFATDGVHYRAVGAWAAADYLTRKMAFLEGRQCPFPIAPDQPVQDPCPDPDLTGPIADIEGLYPIGRDGILCYELGEERRFECRFDTRVLQLTRELEPGAQGSDVGALQTRLQRLGYFEGPVDDTYADTTAAAVSAYQLDQALEATGRADRTTLGAMGFDVSAI